MIVVLYVYLVGEVFSDNPSDIAFSVNLMSGICTVLCRHVHLLGHHHFAAWLWLARGGVGLRQSIALVLGLDW